MKRILLTLAALGTALTMQAKVVLPGIFGDNMVLQQQSEAQFWGKAAPGKKVTIRPSWSTQGITANVGKDGRWRAAVPTPEAGGPYTIELSDGERLTLRDVLIGEVWLCSGQSNMEMPVHGFPNQPVEGSAEAIIRARAATPIRLCTVKRSTARTPQEECAAQWLKHTSEAVAGTSATAYYFARYLQSVLDVPVGVIVTCWGGTPVEAWMDRETMSGFKEFDLSFLDNPDQIDRPQYKPCGLYNGMIAPLVPYTVKGFLWYQGESNRPNPTQYRALMPAFVKMLRERWAQGGLPFYYVQIAPYRYDGPDAISGALLREAQLHNLKDIPSSGMAVTLDIGDEGCIHPAKKRRGRNTSGLAGAVENLRHERHRRRYARLRKDGGRRRQGLPDLRDRSRRPGALRPHAHGLRNGGRRPRLPPGHSPDREGQKPPDRRVRRRSETGRRALRLPQRSRSHPFQHLRHPRLLVPHRRLGGEVNACSNRPIRPRGQTSAAGFFQTRISGHVSRRRSGSAKRGFSGWRSR